MDMPDWRHMNDVIYDNARRLMFLFFIRTWDHLGEKYTSGLDFVPTARTLLQRVQPELVS